MLLEEALRLKCRDSSNSLAIEDYCLKNGRMLVDLSLSLRQLSIPFGSTFDVEKRSYKATSAASNVSKNTLNVKICLADVETGQRYSFAINSLSLTLAELLFLYEDAFKVKILDRHAAKSPALEVNGCKHYAQVFQEVTLNAAGITPNTLIRLSYDKSTSKQLFTRPDRDLSVHLVDKQNAPISQKKTCEKNTEIAVVSAEARNDACAASEAAFSPQAYKVLNQMPHCDVDPATNDDSYYEMTAAEAKAFYAQEMRRISEATNAPLKSAIKQKEKNQQAVRAKYPTVKIRFKFGNYTGLETDFPIDAHIDSMFAFLDKFVSNDDFLYDAMIQSQVPSLRAVTSRSFFDLSLYPAVLVVIVENSTKFKLQ